MLTETYLKIIFRIPEIINFRRSIPEDQYLKRSISVKLSLKGHQRWDGSLLFLFVDALIFSLFDDLKRSVFAKLPLKGHEAFEVDSVSSALLAQCQDPALL